MNSSRSKTYLTSLIIVLAFLQVPIAYFFTEGFFSVVAMLPYALLGFTLSVVAAVKLFRYRSTNKPFHIYGLIIGVGVGLLQPFQFSQIEILDWWLMREDREKIIAEIGSDRNRVVLSQNHELYSIPQNALFSISKGGKVNIKKQHGDTLSIEFYIDRGFIDSYKAFLYTNDSIEQAEIELSIKQGKNAVYKKYDDNWYSIHY